MCGICGKINFSSSNRINERLLHRMTEIIQHRGPDDSGLYINNNVGLGIRRLSIIDLDTGHQPISNEDKSIWVVLNGEIYNYLDLRKSMEAKGHQFQTKTDTEVITHLYEEFGLDCIKKLRGMFAFALWDNKEKKLFLARDRIGQKPLYYAIVDGSLVFGSEIKVILQDPKIERRIDKQALDEYLEYGFIPSPKTIYKGIYKLPPAHYLICKNGKIIIKRYWSVEYHPDNNKSEKFYTQRLTELINESVKLRLMSDVPLGSFLSGGLDSSLIVAIMSGMSSHPIKTFSIGYKENSFNELKYARIVSDHFNTDHNELEVNCEVESILPKLVWHLDEPFADSSIIPTYYVSKMAQKHVKVSLSGDAADEIFAGYRRYKARRMINYFNYIPKWIQEKILYNLSKHLPESVAYTGTSNIKKFKRFLETASIVNKDPWFSSAPIFNQDQKNKLYKSNFDDNVQFDSPGFFDANYQPTSSFANLMPKDKDQITHMLMRDLVTSLPEQMLNRVDRMSMAVSLEARAPLLDHKIIEFMAKVPTSLKLKGFTSKYILKKSVEHLLPKNIVYRNKQGFAMPMASWLKHELKSYVGDYLLSETSQSHNYFNKKYIEEIINKHNNGYHDYNRQIWALLSFEIWHRTILEGD